MLKLKLMCSIVKFKVENNLTVAFDSACLWISWSLAYSSAHLMGRERRREHYSWIDLDSKKQATKPLRRDREMYCMEIRFSSVGARMKSKFGLLSSWTHFIWVICFCVTCKVQKQGRISYPSDTSMHKAETAATLLIDSILFLTFIKMAPNLIY